MINTVATHGDSTARTVLRLLGLIGLTYAVASATGPGLHDKHLPALLLTIGTAVSWTAWVLGRRLDNRPLSVAGLVALAVSGGAITALNPVGVVVVAVAGMGAVASIGLISGAVVGLCGVAATAVGVTVTGHTAKDIGAAAIGAVAGLGIGALRRQQQVHAEQAVQLAMAQQRTDIEHERAEVLAERNRIAREVHDVLAHTLSALSVQMEALDSLIDDGAGKADVQAAVRRTRGLVVDGLDETRRAVRVLRDEPVPIAEQIGQLADGNGVTCEVDGTPRSLAPAAGLALLRVAQEGVTNARKHAPGLPVTVTLRFAEAATSVCVTNPLPAGSANTSILPSGGYGLRGMRERVELVNGSLSAGADGKDWRVLAEIPE
jgi:signal transduction histidine kinase